MLVVAHAEGFGQLPFSEVRSNTVVALQPWGRIEGVAQLGGKPLASETIRLGAMTWRLRGTARVSLYVGATPDSEGRFVFDAVPPGEWKVQREINASTRKVGIHFPVYSHGVPVIVRPGETARVVLGGSGRPVIGKALVPGSDAAIPWEQNSVILLLKVPTVGAPLEPVRQDYNSDEAFSAARATFAEQNSLYWNSEQGVALQRVQRQYAAPFSPDGSFRIEDVPPGDYTLKVNLIDPPARPNQDFVNIRTIASVEKDVTIPPTNGDDGGATDLGVVQLTPASPSSPNNSASIR
jgi:hypothetical protein